MDIKCNSPTTLESILKMSSLPSRSSLYLRNPTLILKCTKNVLLTFVMYLLVVIFFLAFTKCAHQRTFSLAWACRKEHKAMKDCMEKL